MSAVTANSWADAYARRSGFAPLRRAAWERFVALGLPHVRQEEWRFTNPAPITQRTFLEPVASGKPTLPTLGAWEQTRIALVNGRLDASLSSPGVRALAEEDAVLGTIASWQERPFVALNTALFEDGAYVSASRKPVVIGYATTPGREPVATHPRVLVVVEPGASLTVIEDFRGAQTAGDFVNAVIEFDLGESATVEHVSLLGEHSESLHVGAAFARLAARARFSSRSIALGGKLLRRDVHVTFAGPGGEATLDGLYVTSGSELFDHHTTADHAVPSCTSRELFKGVLAGASRAVFNGAVVIRPGAQKSDAAQQNQNLLLSEDATIDTKPELQIFADDVKCAHGATVGQLDDAALFYLRARGIDLAQAKAILTTAFAREVVERIPHEGLRADVDALVERRMDALR